MFKCQTITAIALLSITPVLSAPRGKIEKKPLVDIYAQAQGKILRWQFAPGEILELKKFSEQIIKSGKASDKRSVFHRVLLEAKAPDPVKGYALEGTFTSLIRSADAKQAYGETEKYAASFFMKPTGQFSVEKNQYMPNIRSVPTFSENRDPALSDEAAMEIGTTWEKPGEEAMRFASLISVPFNARYEYRGIENVKSEEGEKSCHKFISNYELSYGGDDPAGPRVFGYVTAVWFWDAQQGIPYYATEEYNIIIVNEQGLANEFKIKSRSYYRKFRKRTDTAKLDLAERLKETIDKEDPDLTVRVTDQGVAISLPDVFFDTDSTKLNRPAKQALERLGQILKKTSAPHIRVRGHTDATGDETHNLTLSEKRAERVAEYLIDNAELNADSLSFDGKGAKDPVADNITAEGRAKNRRVEIILLDK